MFSNDLNIKSSKKGFTMFEVLLTVAAIAIIAGASVPFYQSFQVRNDLDIGIVTVAQSLRRAQSQSKAMSGDIPWGVNISNDNVILFKGESFTTRDSEFDEVFSLPSSITASGLSEIVFTKFSGLPQITGTVTLTSSTQETRDLSVNEKGTISY